jgi:hypothetical protein
VEVVKVRDDLFVGCIGVVDCDRLVGDVMVGVDIFQCFHALTLTLTMNNFCWGPPFLIMTCFLNFEN